MKSWIKILKGYRDGQFPQYHYGLTLKLIVGGCQMPIQSRFNSEKDAYESTKEIFEEMQEFKQNELVVITNNCEIGTIFSFAEQYRSGFGITVSFEQIWQEVGPSICIGDFNISDADLESLKRIFN